MIRPHARKLWPWAGAALALAGVTHFHQQDMSRRYHAGRVLKLGGQPLHVMEGGRPDAPPAILVHGSDGVGLDWLISPLWRALAPHRRLIAYDRPGHGHSPVPPGERVSLGNNAGDLHLLLEP